MLAATSREISRRPLCASVAWSRPDLGGQQARRGLISVFVSRNREPRHVVALAEQPDHAQEVLELVLTVGVEAADAGGVVKRNADS